MRARCQTGFTLLEVLVAVFVLALGVIGVAGMQVTALRTRHESSLRTGAVQLGSALAERMRANAEQMGRADGANPYLALRYDAALDGPPAPPAALCYGRTDCSSAEMAEFDLFETMQALRAHFPGGRIVVCRDSAPWDAKRGALAWDCAGAAAAPVVLKLGWRARNPDGSAYLDGAGAFAPSVAFTLAQGAR